jgi:hypothetical protein
MDGILNLLFVGAIVAFVVLLIMGASNRVVIFEDYKDVAVTAGIFIAGVFGVSLVQQVPADHWLRYVYGTVTGIVMIAFSFMTVRTAIRSNSSVPLGLFVGIFKVLMALLSIFLLIGSLSRIFGNNSTIAQRTTGFALAGVLFGLFALLVNGRRVRAKRAIP